MVMDAAAPDPVLVLAGGLLEQSLGDGATDDDVRAVLAGLSRPDLLWRKGLGLPYPLQGALSEDHWLPWWQPPGKDFLHAHREVIRAGWLELSRGWRDHDDSPHTAPIRVSVTSLDDLFAVRELGEVDGRLVVPTLRTQGGWFTWQVPPRVVVAGPRAELWRQVVTEAHWFELNDQEPDLLILDVDAEPDAEAAELARCCGAVLAVGSGAASDLLDLAHQLNPQASILAGVPAPFEQWWERLIHSGLHENLPIDVALAWLVPEALVAGVGVALSLTATPSEHHAEEVRADLGPQRAAIEPPPRDGGPDPRRLVAELYDGERRLRSVVPPERKLSLEVKVKVPEQGEIAGDVPVPVDDIPGVLAVLDIDVNAPGWEEPLHAQVGMPMEDNREPSSSAWFDVTSPADGGVLAVTIDVSYHGRLLQHAALTAPVRPAARPGDRVRLLVQQSTAGPAPVSAMTPAGVQLDATAEVIVRRSGAGGRVPLSNLPRELDHLELMASAVLGKPDPPADFTDQRARTLLIRLARLGVDLRDQLNPLGLDAEKVISLIVDERSAILPLELVYAGEAPEDAALVCDHWNNPPAAGEGCDRTGPRRVCPYAFWGLTKTIIRDVVVGSGSEAGPTQRLDLSPVLYAANPEADANATDALPTQQLGETADTLFGGLQRVTSWRAWRQQVAKLQPELLLMLAHTDLVDGQAALVIGRRVAPLRRQLIRSADLVAPGGRPPLVVLIACASAKAADPFGSLAGQFASRGAAAVVGMLSQLEGRQAAKVGQALLAALHAGGGQSLGAALTVARRELLSQGLLVGLLLVAHGQIDVEVG